MKENKKQFDNENNIHTFTTDVSIGIKNLHRIKLLSKCGYTKNFTILLFLAGVLFSAANIFHLPGIFEIANGLYSGSITLNISTLVYLVACVIDYNYVKTQIDNHSDAYNLNLTDNEKQILSKNEKIQVEFKRTSITSIEFNYLLNIIGLLVFLSGSIGFMPFSYYLYPGLYITCVGSAIIEVSQIWKVARFFNESDDEETLSNTNNVVSNEKTDYEESKKFKATLQIYNKFLKKQENLGYFLYFEILMLGFTTFYLIATLGMTFGADEDMMKIMAGYIIGSTFLLISSIILFFIYFFSNSVNNAIFDNKLCEKLI